MNTKLRKKCTLLNRVQGWTLFISTTAYLLGFTQVLSEYFSFSVQLFLQWNILPLLLCTVSNKHTTPKAYFLSQDYSARLLHLCQVLQVYILHRLKKTMLFLSVSWKKICCPVKVPVDKKGTFLRYESQVNDCPLNSFSIQQLNCKVPGHLCVAFLQFCFGNEVIQFNCLSRIKAVVKEP